MRQIKENFTKKDILIVGLALIAVAAVIAAAIWPVTTRSKDKTDGAGQNASNSSAQSAEKLTDSIELPGYGELSFKAGTERQEVCLSNPEKNFCYIRASLLLEDGTLLWTSELIAPGEESGPVVFSTPLSAGEYKDAVLKYECFMMDEALTPLNGVETNLTLKVK